MFNLNEDLSQITTIPTRQLDKLDERRCYCINNAVVETLNEGKNSLEINIGLGYLTVEKVDQGIRYLFKPSKALEESVKQAFQGKRSELIEATASTLIDRITNAYKDLI